MKISSALRPYYLVGFTFVCLLTVLFLFSKYSLAEDPARGRMADGRAFRTDAEGNQLVDYIAELELNVETLQRKAIGLEDELKEKQQRLSRYESGQTANIDRVSERTLVSDQKNADQRKALDGSQVSTAGSNAGGLSQRECPPVPVCPSTARDCSVQINQVRAELDAARGDLEVERQLHKKQQGEAELQLVNLKGDVKSRDIRIEELRQQLGEKEKNNASIASALDQEKSKSAKLGDLENALESQREELARVKTEREQALARAKLETQRASIAPRASESVTNSEVEERAGLSTARLRAVESVRGSMLTELNQVKGLISTRDQMYRKYAAQKHTVAFQPSRATASSGRGTDEIARRIQSAQSMIDISPLRRDIAEIEQRMQEDIALMKRMERVR